MFPPAVTTIRELESLIGDADCAVFHSGTRRDGKSIYTTGGRVLGVTAVGATLADARTAAYEVVERIRFDGCHYRSDIGATAVS